MRVYDCHNHMDAPELDDTRAEMVEAARQSGVRNMIISAGDPAHWDRTQAVAQRLGVVWTLGLHPWWVSELPHENDHWLNALAQRDTPHGLGEMGLDGVLQKTRESRYEQVRVLRVQLDLAVARDLPIVVHGARAWGHVIDELTAWPQAIRGMLHSFDGSAELARVATARGFFLSFGPSIAWSRRAQAAAAAIDDRFFLLETDAPHRPIARQGQGAPRDVLAVAEHVAHARGTSVNDVLERSARNAEALFPSLRG